jgi:sulfane dehydrogenase subunit SoxC
MAVAVSAASVAVGQSVQKDSTERPGAPATPYGDRSSFETEQRLVTSGRHASTTASWTPLDKQLGQITPSGLHFERHHAGVPVIAPENFDVMVHGLVKQPLVFTLEDLKRFPQISKIHFVECSGNTASEWSRSTGKTVQRTHGLTSCVEWTGVSLSGVLKECGLREGAKWVVAEGADAAMMTRSIPLEKCLDDCLLAYGQNGEALRPEQGYPLRLLVPGWEGNMSVKWLRRLKLVSEPYQTREETSKYTDLMPDGSAKQFTFVMNAKSVIISPSGGQQLMRKGFQEIRGIAWSGRGKIVRVEVNAGAGWIDAKLDPLVLPMAHTRFTLPWRWDGGNTLLASRCTDETGYVQPSREKLLEAQGANSFYHYNGIQQWQVNEDGLISHA